MRDVEHAIQRSFFDWSQYAQCEHPELALLYAIPNGGARNAVTGRRLKEEGVRAGMPDMHLPVARGEYHGLWLELKAPGKHPEKHQTEIHERLRKAGHVVVVVRSFDECRAAVTQYLKHK